MSRLPVLIRITKATVLVVSAWTVFCILAVLAWQATTFAADGYWPSFQFSSAMTAREFGPAVYSTASVSPMSAESELLDDLDGVPAMVLALVMLIAFYAWLTNLERRHDPAFKIQSTGDIGNARHQAR
jgi:hypothetical protein